MTIYSSSIHFEDLKKSLEKQDIIEYHKLDNGFYIEKEQGIYSSLSEIKQFKKYIIITFPNSITLVKRQATDQGSTSLVNRQEDPQEVGQGPVSPKIKMLLINSYKYLSNEDKLIVKTIIENDEKLYRNINGRYIQV